MSDDDEGAQRRLAAKRNNESVKLVATTLNAVGLAIFGAAFVIPGVTDPRRLLSAEPWILLSVAAILHFTAHLVFRLMRSEE